MQVDRQGKLVKAKQGSVPGHLQQSAVNAEHVAALEGAVAIETSSGLAVINSFKHGFKHAAQQAKPQAYGKR